MWPSSFWGLGTVVWKLSMKVPFAKASGTCGNSGGWMVKRLAVWESQSRVSGVLWPHQIMLGVACGKWNTLDLQFTLHLRAESCRKSKNLEIPPRSKVVNISVPSKWWEWTTHICHCVMQWSGSTKHGGMEMLEADRLRHLYFQPCTFTAVGSG